MKNRIRMEAPIYTSFGVVRVVMSGDPASNTPGFVTWPHRTLPNTQATKAYNKIKECQRKNIEDMVDILRSNKSNNHRMN